MGRVMGTCTVIEVGIAWVRVVVVVVSMVVSGDLRVRVERSVSVVIEWRVDDGTRDVAGACIGRATEAGEDAAMVGFDGGTGIDDCAGPGLTPLAWTVVGAADGVMRVEGVDVASLPSTATTEYVARGFRRFGCSCTATG